MKGKERFQDNRLVALYASRLVDLVRITTLEGKVLLGSGDEVRLGLMESIESLPDEVNPIQNLVNAPERGKKIPNNKETVISVVQ